MNPLWSASAQTGLYAWSHLLNSAPTLAVVSPFYAFEQSDAVGRIIVLLLFIASIVAWSIMAEKWFYLRSIKKHCRTFLDPAVAIPTDQAGPLAIIQTAVLTTAANLKSASPEQVRRRQVNLDDPDVQRLRAIAEAAVDQEIMKMEARLGLLSSIVSASPFLGLLGTVWGVMMAFSGMAVQGRADIKAIAPGVSGALLTTVVGLVVAIPAVIGYNFLASEVKQLSVTMDNYVEDLLTGLRSGGAGKNVTPPQS